MWLSFMSISKTKQTCIWSWRFVREENFSTVLLRKSTSQRDMLPKFSNKFFKLSTIATPRVCATEIWSLRTSFTRQKMTLPISKLLISDWVKFWTPRQKDCLAWRLKPVLHTTSHQKFLPEITTSNAISGQQGASSTSSSADILHSTETMTRKS